MKVGVCGHITDNIKLIGGQTVKTKEFLEGLQKKISSNNVDFINTNGWKKKPFSFLYKIKKLHKQNDIILFLTAQNGIRIFPRLFNFLNRFKRKKVHYIVIGGWLPELLKKNKNIFKSLKKMDGIHVETRTMKNELEILGLNNIYILNNFRNLNPLNHIEIRKNNYPIVFCYFSRVIKEKGIEDLISAVNDINSDPRNIKKCFLDIYGPITNEYKESISGIIDNEYINYKGVVDSKNSLNILKNYYMQIFPTRYYTEGIPGSIIEGYFSGIPVIASKWESFDDLIDEKSTGIGFEFRNKEDLKSQILWAMRNEKKVTEMKMNCLEKSYQYQTEKVISEFLNIIKGE